MDSKRKISRKAFNRNVQLCKINENPDAEILDGLFTMWDMRGEDKILVPPFLLSLAPLSCRYEELKEILKFALVVFIKETNGELSADKLVFILKHLNQTASYFGDTVLTHRQIYKVVDNVFGTMSIISQEGPILTHEEVIVKLVEDPLLNQFLTRDLPKVKQPRVTFSPRSRVHREDGSEMSSDYSVPLTPIARVRLNEPRKSALKKPSTINTNFVDPNQKIRNRPSNRVMWNSRRK
eukprot:scaffold4244_cov167-Amphora_coffeaeformis.AAC.2